MGMGNSLCCSWSARIHTSAVGDGRPGACRRRRRIWGVGIVGSAFLLSWAAEAAQVDVSASLAIAILALIAILPEYTIEVVLAWDAGNSFVPATGEITQEMQRVAANVTGANRLLIGLGWSLVILIFWIKRRRVLDLQGGLSLELAMLTIATLMLFLIFFMGQVHLIVAAVLIFLYLYYLWVSSRQAVEEPELMGPSALLGSLSNWRRRTAVGILFLYSAAVILVAAEPFVHSLVETGLDLLATSKSGTHWEPRDQVLDGGLVSSLRSLL